MTAWPPCYAAITIHGREAMFAVRIPLFGGLSSRTDASTDMRAKNAL
jgi:hypothetical protein